MIELPLSCNLTSIACCESTGNILVGCKNILQLYLFKYCTNETTKLQYVDFFEAPFQLEIDFLPTKILVTENVVTCCNKQYLHVFKIVDGNVESNNSITISESNVCTSTEVQEQPQEAINMNLEYDVDFQQICNRKELNGIAFKVDIKSNQEETLGIDDAELKPLVINELAICIKFLHPYASPSLVVRSLLQLKLQPLKISGVVRDNVDIFKSIFMRPLYVQPVVSESIDGFFLHSKFHQHFYGCAVLVTTQQDGYLYQINTNTDDSSKAFLNVYPFTSSVIDVFFNFNVLHALCENGVESYTHRIGQKLFSDLSGKHNLPEMDIYKNLSTKISLVNLRPFMSVHYMLPCDDNFVLLASDSSTDVVEDEAINWTIYNLKYPPIDTIYQDFKEFADKSLKRYPSFYMNLIEEIHIMIKSHMLLGELQLEENNSETGNEMRLVWRDCEKLLEESSLALADCLILNPCESQHSLIFYDMAKLNITQIFQRFLTQNGISVSKIK